MGNKNVKCTAAATASVILGRFGYVQSYLIALSAGVIGLMDAWE